jgi:copper homeostasis protein
MQTVGREAALCLVIIVDPSAAIAPEPEMAVTLEICVPDATSAIEAERGGAHRIELCENLGVGGTTPSAGSIALACRLVRVPVHVLIRPRAGGFCYSELEREIMVEDVLTAKRLGASAVVIGALTSEATVDSRAIERLVAVARPMGVTFHKAFDLVAEPFDALATLIDLGVDRLLTSGRQPTAIQGLPLIEDLARASGDRIRIIAGGGITPRDAKQIVATALITEIHVGSAVYTSSNDATPRDSSVPPLMPLTHASVDARRVSKILEAIEATS